MNQAKDLNGVENQPGLKNFIKNHIWLSAPEYKCPSWTCIEMN